jgi:preprotein translocase subunit SecA
LVGLVCDFNASELAAVARAAFAEGLVDEEIRNEDDLEEDLTQGEELLADFLERYEPVNAINECSRWMCFPDDESLDSWVDDDLNLEDPPRGIFGSPPAAWADLPAPTPYIPPPKPTPYVAPSKAGRNDPCPCGSGKKYKKCCGK